LNRFANDQIVGDSDDDEMVDDDEESIEEEIDEDKPRNPFKQPKEPKEYVPRPKKNMNHQKHDSKKKPSIFFGTGKTKAEIIKMICEYAKECRPLGRVKAIMKSPNREKDHMITLTI